MPIHDIIDNRSEKLVDHINRILRSSNAARFAVGYFFLSGLESISKSLAPVKELKLLIGNTTNRETIEQIAEGYQRLDLVAERAEADAYPKRSKIKRWRIKPLRIFGRPLNSWIKRTKRRNWFVYLFF